MAYSLSFNSSKPLHRPNGHAPLPALARYKLKKSACTSFLCIRPSDKTADSFKKVSLANMRDYSLKSSRSASILSMIFLMLAACSAYAAKNFCSNSEWTDSSMSSVTSFGLDLSFFISSSNPDFSASSPKPFIIPETSRSWSVVVSMALINFKLLVLSTFPLVRALEMFSSNSSKLLLKRCAGCTVWRSVSGPPPRTPSTG